MFCNPLDVSAITSWIANDPPAATDVIFLLVAAQSQHQVPDLLHAMQQQGIQCFGGVFTQIIYGPQAYDAGCIATRLKLWHPPILVEGIDRTPVSLDGLPNLDDLPPGLTLAIFADTEVPCLPEFLNQVYRYYGNRVQYFGGGAGLLGDIPPEKKPCVFSTQGGFKEKSAVLALVEQPGVINANHGWQRVHGPMLATEIEGDVLKQLNWQSAFEVYKQVVEAQTGQPLKPEDLGTTVSLGYPFGMLKQESEDMLRLPIEVKEGGGVVCVGGLHNNCVLHILRGTPEMILEAAQQTIDHCTSKMQAPATHKIVIDCLTRSWFLEERFPEELNLIHDGLNALGDTTMIGALSKGELASVGQGYLEMLNKSLAIGTFS